MMKKLLLGLVGAGCVMSAPAFAGEWKLNPQRCPDLVEDRFDRRESRRDERFDHSRRAVREDRYDRRESRRDRSITVCPRSAFYYVPDRWERAHKRHHRVAPLRLTYDRRIGMSYKLWNGERIYVRA